MGYAVLWSKAVRRQERLAGDSRLKAARKGLTSKKRLTNLRLDPVDGPDGRCRRAFREALPRRGLGGMIEDQWHDFMDFEPYHPRRLSLGHETLSISSDFDALDINGDCNIALADGVCDVFTEVDSVDPSHQFESTPQLQAGETVTLVLSTLNEVPSTVPLGAVELFFTHPVSGDPAIPIPVPSG